MQNLSYIIGDDDTRLAAVVDPGYDMEKIVKTVNEQELQIKYIINTHEHFDHTGENRSLAVYSGAEIVAHEDSPIDADIFVKDGDILKIGELEVKIIHTPGHSPGGICLLVDKKLITGDTLFVGECGRVDLPGGSAEELYDSLFNKIATLDNDIEVYPGHDYGQEPYSTIGYEKQHNYVLKPRTKEQFIQFMAE
jgi:hydroxyacylglutathione hydrolase